jgi:NAD(P)-dependent dehydrogenase (short-subunit alcohol dehydrogenase family)
MDVQTLFTLDKKVAIVTGANGLIGRRHVEALSEAGATVIACDIQPTSAIGSLDQNVHYFRLDVTDKANLEQVRDEILKNWGRIDILVNNAAVNDMFENPELAATQSMFENYPLEKWERSWKVNVTGVFLCSQVFGSVMAEQGGGSVINVASTYGMVGPDQSIYINPAGEQVFYKSVAYPATKGAIINFTRFLASYWGKKGVRVNTLSPGGVENGQDYWFIENYASRTCLGRMAKADDYKGALIFLASDASAYMTGANLVVDGGWTAI